MRALGEGAAVRNDRGRWLVSGALAILIVSLILFWLGSR